MSAVGVVLQSAMQWLGLRSNQPRYCARLYYSSRGIHTWEVYFVIMKDLEAHRCVSDSPLVMRLSVVCPAYNNWGLMGLGW